MAFRSFPLQRPVTELLQRSLARRRLGHAYLFCGSDISELEHMARTLAKTLNCENPERAPSSDAAQDSCDACPTCLKIDEVTHPDVHELRPESKSRIITIDQIRELMKTLHLKPSYASCKVAIVSSADRLNPQAANAFLKTLEEPPGHSILILTSTDPQRLLETILSRCLRLVFAGRVGPRQGDQFVGWLQAFADQALTSPTGMLNRYRLVSVLLRRLAEMRQDVTSRITKASPLERYEDIDSSLRDKWQEELEASIEAEYRRQRSEVLRDLQWWLHDIWLHTLGLPNPPLSYPQLDAATQSIASRCAPDDALANLTWMERVQRLLNSNVQEALSLELGILKLRF